MTYARSGGRQFLAAIAALAALGSVGQAVAAAQAAEQSLDGNWRASVSLTSTAGNTQTFPNEESPGPVSVVLSKDKLMLWNRDRKVAEMTCRFDPAQTPATINARFQDREMLGIYRLDGDKLQIRLNDAGAARPKDFAAKDNNMALRSTIKYT
jgi:uncharacterized protein (TIGR03067 family)